MTRSRSGSSTGRDIPWNSEYDRTSETEIAVGLASMPSSWTWDPAAPSMVLASSSAAVVIGPSVVDSGSVNARITTLPR